MDPALIFASSLWNRRDETREQTRGGGGEEHPLPPPPLSCFVLAWEKGEIDKTNENDLDRGLINCRFSRFLDCIEEEGEEGKEGKIVRKERSRIKTQGRGGQAVSLDCYKLIIETSSFFALILIRWRKEIVVWQFFNCHVRSYSPSNFSWLPGFSSKISTFSYSLTLTQFLAFFVKFHFFSSSCRIWIRCSGREYLWNLSLKEE